MVRPPWRSDSSVPGKGSVERSTTMAERKRMTADEVVGYLLEGEGLDVLRESLAWVVQQLMEAEVFFFVHEDEVKATVGGEEFTAPAGTFIAVEPSTKRKFEAAASPTTILVVGAPPGRAYQVGAWEK